MRFLPAVPAGFSVSVFADRLNEARWLAAGVGGDVFVTESAAGQVLLLRDPQGRGRALPPTVFANGFDRPSGLAVQSGHLYVADADQVWRLPYRPGAAEPAGPREAVTDPGGFGDGGTGKRWSHILAVSPDGTRFVVGAGPSDGSGEESSPPATIRAFSTGDRIGQTLTSDRDTAGLAFSPGTRELYVAVGADGGPKKAPSSGGLARIGETSTLVPDLSFQSPLIPWSMAFSTGVSFPIRYRGGVFVILLEPRTTREAGEAMVAYVPFRDHRPAGGYEPFLRGFRMDGTGAVQGRPAGLAVAQDGSLLVADDIGRVVWRVSYDGVRFSAR
ncbi:MAG: PQQ-dependent sugar dehydrogenase [Alphaproteobacteria bacterium]